MYLNRQIARARMVSSTTASHSQKRTLFRQSFLQKLVFVTLELVICMAGILILFNIHSPSHVLDTTTDKFQWGSPPGQGVSTSYAAWVRPQKGQEVSDVIGLEASVSPVLSDNFKVASIIFTAWWPGVDPHNWKNICSVSSPTPHNVFRCEGNLRQLQAPRSTLILSFDVYDAHHHVRLAPNGGFPVTYSSSSVI